VGAVRNKGKKERRKKERREGGTKERRKEKEGRRKEGRKEGRKENTDLTRGRGLYFQVIQIMDFNETTQ
jgi:hypothetical protein